jgi:NAD(P)-dependent dehydrogenase (short-subunit alcohol dehydrogenase family)
MSGRLQDKVALITGAGTGIGRAIAIAFGKEGASVGLIGRRRNLLEAVAREIGNIGLVIQADVAEKSDIDRAIKEIVNSFGGLNVIVNNAGVLHIGTSEQITDDQWDETFNVNVRGVWQVSKSALPYLRQQGGGSIINIASVLGVNGARNRGAYAASKGAVVLLTKCMALDHGSENIRVNAICPGFVETELTQQVFAQAPDPETVRRERTAVHPIGRLGQPQDIAGLAVFLASDESAWVTGAVLPVDGGYLAL